MEEEKKEEKKKIVLELNQFEIFKLEQIINLGSVELKTLEMKTNKESKVALDKVNLISRLGSKLLDKVTSAIDNNDRYKFERAIFEKRFVEKMRREGIEETNRLFGGK